MDFDALMQEARKRVTHMQDADARGPRTEVERVPLPDYLAASAQAIQCGMKEESWLTVAEGLCMLQDAIARVRMLGE